MTRRLLSLPIKGDQTSILAIDVMRDDDGRVWFIADCDIDCDGPNGNPDNDPYWQPETTYRHNGKSIDSYKVPGIVLPPAIIRAVPEIVMGCKARITYFKTEFETDCIVYDQGPTKKAGEASVEAAERVGIPSNPNTGGEDNYNLALFECWPGQTITIDGITYALQPS